MLKMICFDLDGTLADLYNVPNWLTKLRAYDPSPYADATPLCDMQELASLLAIAQQQGIEIRIITWLSKETTAEYDEIVRTTKRTWVEAYHLPFNHFHAVKYGATKADSVRKALHDTDTAILFDDNAKVRQGWHLGDTYDPTVCDICQVLKNILNL